MCEQRLPSRGSRGGRHWRKVSPCAGENSEVPHQLRDADLDVKLEKKRPGGRSATAEQPALSAQGALALQWRGGAHWAGAAQAS